MRLREAGFWPLKPIRWRPLSLGIILLSLSGCLFGEHLIEDGAINVTVAVFGAVALVSIGRSLAAVFSEALPPGRGDHHDARPTGRAGHRT
jgi:hypothetical protein